MLTCGVLAAATPVEKEDPAEDAYQTGAAAMRDRDYPNAIAAFDRAATLRPDHRKTWLGLGMAHVSLQQWDGAIGAYERLIEIEPEDGRAHHNLANIHYRLSRYEEAVEGYRRAFELDAGYVLAAFHYGWTLRQLNRAEKAEWAFRRCLEIQTDDPSARNTKVDCLFGLASIRHRARDYASSAEMMERVLAVHPDHVEARYYLGMAYRQLGRLNEAREQLEIHRRMLSARRVTAPTLDARIEP
jgi:tetratricopeptide (TPR) repeat protein